MIRRKRFEQGDHVKISDIGQTYTTYLQKAIQLGADISDDLYRWYDDGEDFAVLDGSMAKDESYSWVYDKSPSTGDGCIVLRMGSTDHILVQRICDGKQFIMASRGLTYDKSTPKWLEDEDFLI